MELLNKLGINLTLFIAQLVNFVIVLGVMYFFVYKPLLRILDKRKNMIHKSINEAHQIERQLKDAQEEVQKIITQANTEAQEIIKKSSQEAQKMRNDLLAQTKEDIEQMTQKHTQQLKAQKEEMMKEIKEEVVDLTVFAMMQTLNKEMTKEVDKKYISQLMKNV